MLRGPFLSKNWMASVSDYDEAKIVMLGLPFDGTCSYRPGSRFAPERLRPASWGLEEYSSLFQKDMNDSKFFDAGELEFPFGNTSKTLEIIEQNVSDILSDNKKFLGIGGEHLVTLGAFKACLKKYPDLVLVHFDAHTDLREDYLGEKNSHACVIRRISELTGFENIRQIGIRSGTKEEFDLMREHFTLINSFEQLKPFENKKIYLTIDLDVLDPSIMSGTGTPEPGGMSYDELSKWLLELSKYDIAAADVVELAPDYDMSGVSTAVSAKVIRDVLMVMQK